MTSSCTDRAVRVDVWLADPALVTGVRLADVAAGASFSTDGPTSVLATSVFTADPTRSFTSPRT
jgi:hypothetical protein